MWGRNEGRRKRKIYWWLLTLNTLDAPSHPPTLPPSPPGDLVVVQTLLYREWFGDGGAFQDLARYLSGLQTDETAADPETSLVEDFSDYQLVH